MSVSADLLFSRPGQQDAVSVPAGEISCSWALNGPGSLSARIPRTGLAAAGIEDPLGGWWVRWEHATAGTWGGAITDVTWSLDDGTVEIAATSFAGLLAYRRTPRTYSAASATAGALAIRAIADVTRNDATILSSWDAEESGAIVKVEWRGDDLLRVLQGLADASGQEWMVDADRAFRWAVRLGTTRNGVQLIDGVHITGGSVTGSTKNVINDLLAIAAAGKAYRNAPALAVQNVASIEAYGRREGALVYTDLRAISALEQRARRDVTLLGTPPKVPTVDVADVQGVWANLREGDIVWVLIPFADVNRRMRILSRSVDIESGVMRIAGPLELADVAVPGTEPVFEVAA